MRRIYQAAAIATLFALGGILVSLLAGGQLPSGLSPQPYAVDSAMFRAPLTEHTDAVLLFFVGDTLLPIAYALVFVGLYVVTAKQARPFARVGLGAGLGLALFDVTENAIFISYALMAQQGIDIGELPIPLFYAVTTLKWTLSFACLLSFGLVFPRRTALEKVMRLLMLVYPVVGALGVSNADMRNLRGPFLLLGMIFFAFYFGIQWHAIGYSQVKE